MGNRRSVGVHDGPFHADEVMACALLLHCDLIDVDAIVRTRDPEKLRTYEFVCDTGGIYDATIKRFDHHQVEYQGPLSSAGMILLYLYDQGKIEEDLYHYFRMQLIDGIDAHDNGRSTCQVGTMNVSIAIALFNPLISQMNPEASILAFHRALEFARFIIEKLKKQFLQITSCKEQVKEAMQRGTNYLLFDEALSWQENFFALGGQDHPALFVVMPALEGSWKLRGIPPSPKEQMKVRCPLPASWAGLNGDKLIEACGIKGAVFCHKGRFISIWKTRQAVLQALDKAMEQVGKV